MAQLSNNQFVRHENLASFRKQLPMPVLIIGVATVSSQGLLCDPDNGGRPGDLLPTTTSPPIHVNTVVAVTWPWPVMTIILDFIVFKLKEIVLEFLSLA